MKRKEPVYQLIYRAIESLYKDNPNMAWTAREISRRMNTIVDNEGINVNGDPELTSDLVRVNINNAITKSKLNYENWLTAVNEYVSVDKGYSRRIVGWKIADAEDVEIIIENNKRKLVNSRGLEDSAKKTLYLAQDQGILETTEVRKILKEYHGKRIANNVNFKALKEA